MISSYSFSKSIFGHTTPSLSLIRAKDVRWLVISQKDAEGSMRLDEWKIDLLTSKPGLGHQYHHSGQSDL